MKKMALLTLITLLILSGCGEKTSTSVETPKITNDPEIIVPAPSVPEEIDEDPVITGNIFTTDIDGNELIILLEEGVSIPLNFPQQDFKFPEDAKIVSGKANMDTITGICETNRIYKETIKIYEEFLKDSKTIDYLSSATITGNTDQFKYTLRIKDIYAMSIDSIYKTQIQIIVSIQK